MKKSVSPKRPPQRPDTPKWAPSKEQMLNAEKLINTLDERLGLLDPMDTEPAIIFNPGERLKK